MIDRLHALRSAIPQPVDQREIRCPEEVPGYDDWRRFGEDRWRQIGPALYTDGTHVLIWAPADPAHGLLLWGAKARTILERTPPPRVPTPGAGGPAAAPGTRGGGG